MSVDQLKADIQTIRTNKDQLDLDLTAKISEAKILIASIASGLLSAIRDDRSVTATGIKITRKRRERRVIFEITFTEGDLVNRRDFSESVQKMNDLTELAGINPIYVEEK